MKRAFFVAAFILSLASTVAYSADDVSLDKKAWAKYNNGEYQDAYELFSRLHEQNRKNVNYALGLAYSALKLDKPDEALSLAGEFENQETNKTDFKQIKHTALFTKGKAAYDAKDYREAALNLKRLYDSGGADNGAAELLAWSYYNDGELEKAAHYFDILRNLTGEERFNDILFTVYERLGSFEGAAFALKQSEGKDPKAKKRAAFFFFTMNCPVIAAGIDPSSDNCFYNADKPSITIDSFYRSKTGDYGTSKLMETSTALKFEYPFGSAYTLGIKAVGVMLDSGQAPTHPFAGNFANTLPVNQLVTSVNGYYPEFSLRREGVATVELTGGSTPSGGEVSPAITGALELSIKRARFELHRKAVDESILSYTGLKDPYGTQSWGRVLKTGVEGEKTFLLDGEGKYWFTLKAGYDSYDGENVIENKSIAAYATLGGSYETTNSDIYTGIFSSYKSFDKNSNFFTFGHGGYFSPEKFFIAGPFLNVSTKPCGIFRAGAQGSVGYRSYSEEDARQFPLNQSSSAMFSGEDVSGIGFDLSGYVKRLFFNRLILGASLNFSKAADYTEFKGGVLLKYLFEPVNAVSMY